MSLLQLSRGAHVLMGLFLAASTVVMLDDSGALGEQPELASTAEAIRGLGSGELTGGLEDIGKIKDEIARIANSFNELGEALAGNS